MGASERLQVRVNDEPVLDAGPCEDVTRAHGLERLIRPPMTTLFNQVLAYLREKPDPPKRPSGSMVGREGIAAAAVTLRWGSYLSVLLDHDKPVWPGVDALKPLTTTQSQNGDPVNQEHRVSRPSRLSDRPLLPPPRP
jgi:hypothetical protein